MSKKKVGLELDIDLTGSKELAEVELRLKEIAKAMREAAKAGDTEAYAKLRQEQIKLQSSSKDLRKELRDQVKDFKAAKLPADSIEALRREYIALKKELLSISSTDANFDKKAAEAKALNDRIKELEKSLGDTRRNVGNYQADIEAAFGNISQAIGGNISSLAAGLGAGGLIIAGVDLVSEGLQVVRDLSKEIIQLQGRVSQVTDLQGEELVKASSQVKALADTFNKDVDEIIIAANSAAKGFGTSFGEALSAIETGLLSGADVNGELLDNFREYPAVLNNAGISLEEFVKLSNQQVEGGTYNDKLLDTIKETDLALKELTATQQKALEPLGSEFVDKLSEGIRTGAITSVEAILLIREQSEKLGLDLQQTQTITADVFKGAGEDAGGFQKVIESVFTALDTEYEDLVDESNNLVQAQRRALSANQEFALAQIELAEALGSTDSTISSIVTRIKTGFVSGLADLINRGREFFSVLSPLREQLVRLLQNLGILNDRGKATSAILKVLSFNGQIIEAIFQGVVTVITFFIDRLNKTVEGVRRVGRFLGIVKKEQDDVAISVEKAQKNVDRNVENLRKKLEDVETQTTDTKETVEETTKTLETLGDTADKIAKTGIAGLQAQLSQLKVELAGAESKEAYASTLANIQALEKQIESTKNKYEAFAAAKRLAEGRGEDAERFSFTGAQPGEAAPLPGIDGLESVENTPEAKAAKALADYKKTVAKNLQRFEEELREESLSREEESFENRVGIVADAGARIGESLGRVVADSETSLQDFAKVAALIALDSAEQIVNLALAELFAKQVASSGIVGIAKASILQGVIRGFTSAIFSTIKSSIGEFAEGGQVLPKTKPGILNERPNAPRTAGGDNVLIYAKPGEMILNRQQQQRARQLYGGNIWELLGVPGFNAGGIVGNIPQLVAPVGNTASSSLTIGDAQVSTLAEAVASRTAQETASRTAQGVYEAILSAEERRERLAVLRRNQIK